MSKVFRIHTGGKETISNWEDSVKIGSTAIDKIPDPVGAPDKLEITSIPSPFARMDLVKNAFKIVADSSLDGSTIYHKLVSEALDVGQIFFNIEKYRDVIEIIVWDKQNALAELEFSSFCEHNRLGRTYSTFLQQDQDEYHFDKMECVYLLNYKAPSAPSEMNIIGATSPSTLFFTSANDLSFVGHGQYAIAFGNNRPFNDNYTPLYQREDAYIKYWWSLKKSRPDFAALFPEVNTYLDKCFYHFSPSLKKELQALPSEAYFEEYDDITVKPMAQNYVMVLDQRLKRKRQNTSIESDFEMLVSPSLRKPNVKIPLALPVETFNATMKYVIDSWNKNTIVPYCDEREIDDRTLPEDGSKYPYVTIGDFLEDNIIKIPYKFNSRAFFNGNVENPDANDSYLLPIKKEFFDYFTVTDLRGKVHNHNMIEIQRLTGGTGVKVILRIPVKRGFIKYERIYYKADKADKANNKGVIVEREFTLVQFPSINYYDGITPYYRVAILDRDTIDGRDNCYNLEFYDNNNQKVEYDELVQPNKNSDGHRIDVDRVDSATYALSNGYQYIHVIDRTNPDINSVVIPIFITKTGSHKFRFAIDFGTTNTHIEYSVDGGSPKSFNVDETDEQIQILHLISNDHGLSEVLRSDFIPPTIGGESIYSYPMRTVLSEPNNTNWSRPVLSMAHANIQYSYEKYKQLSYNVLHTDLKWSTNPDDKQRAAMYIECLLVMLRNKVLLNNGDLSRTEIVWFYPASMTQSRFNKFKDEWEKSYTKLFRAPVTNIIPLSESVAPYYYHRAKQGATSNVVSIDIGGGTTDVLIVDNGEPKFLTSFRFAANTIFGDGYSYDSDSNGFVKEYSNKILHLLIENSKSGDLVFVNKSLLEKKVSTDILAFFFSLSSNKETRDVIDFNQMLADDNRGKYVVILFYTAIIYHVAQIMKAKKLPMPRHITFSGNGSKILSILSTNNSTLERFTKKIFEEIYHKTYPSDGLSIIRPDNSKESTCKGGVILSPFQPQDYSHIKEMKTTLLGNDDVTFAAPILSYSDIDSKIISGVVESTKNFIEFAFRLDRSFSFYEEFDADKSIMGKVKQICLRDVKTYLDYGISLKEQMLQQDGADNNIEETLFFYPLVGILNAVVREIYTL